jgi:hypothetical protein
MKGAVKIFSIYLVSLLILSLLLSWLGITEPFFSVGNKLKVFSPMIIVTIIGGVISLKYTVSSKAFIFFLIVYFFLWLLRIGILFLSNHIGEINIWHKTYHFYALIPNYYENVSRIGTPLPFIIFWFINYIFTNRHNMDAGEKDKPL